MISEGNTLSLYEFLKIRKEENIPQSLSEFIKF